MSIQKEFVLRYREYGHVRFSIPQVVCTDPVARMIIDKISTLDGLQTVKIFAKQQKLSIRFNEAICDFPFLANQLYSILSDLTAQGFFKVSEKSQFPEQVSQGLKRRFTDSRIGRWFAEQKLALKETAQAAKVLGKLTTKGPKSLIKNPEKATIDFLNDILVLYLIKIHWTRITQHWLVKPLTYRYEWLAVFYLFFLFVRSRQKK